jgi:hypothetical protein
VIFTVYGYWPPLDNDYNAYWLYPESNLPQYAGNCLWVDDYDGSIDAVHDQTLAAAPAYQAGPFGGFYLPASAWQVSTGSRSPADAGLYNYTTSLSEAKDGGQSRVNIGLHYVAAGANGMPLDSDLDGVPDYVADSDGNGIPDSSDSTRRSSQANSDVFQVQQGSTDNPPASSGQRFRLAGLPANQFLSRLLNCHTARNRRPVSGCPVPDLHTKHHISWS